jgi:hypothetical protein
MATLLLGLGGAALGGTGLVGIGGLTWGGLFGTVGVFAGGVVDQALFGTHTQTQQEGPRLGSVDITAATEGAGISRLQGRSVLGGEIIWATRFKEEVSKKTQTAGGKGGGSTVSTTTTTYKYFANFAIGLCEGPITRVGRIWADGKELDQHSVTMRVYRGTETQEADSLIAAKEGLANTPAYRGLAYIVFELMPVTKYGNRIPQIKVEVFRAVGDLEPLVEGVCVIPGSTEFGYDPETILRTGKQEGDTFVATEKGTVADNRTTLIEKSDWQASIGMLKQLAPNCGVVNLVVAWFGSDLRCAECEIRPKVETREKSTWKGADKFNWSVAGVARGDAQEVSLVDGRAAYGGSPNDESVIAAIQDLKDRGFAVILSPFIMMDIAAENTLPNPYSNAAAVAGQAVYPWRGRITCSPAAGFAGTVDKTAAAAAQLNTFLTRTWGYRNFILHYATLAAAAGGVDGFVIGSEMIGLTTLRSAAATYPFVTALKTLAADVRAIVGAGTKLGYAADWSEYHSHRPNDGTSDVFFNLDPLWSDANIDFIGLDNYLPLADWRDGKQHLDYAEAGPTTIYDPDYLAGNIESGEHFDWYYASAAASAAQTRTPIADAAHAEHWVFRNKDIRGWWSNAHRNRPGGVRNIASTDWVPQSKPIWFTELGCPAVDKGANQPNVFFDPKSSESILPYFSTGARDDAMQRASLQATLNYWNDPGNNPMSGVFAGRMINTARICIWAWDSRMSPGFPEDTKSWPDGDNWELGHWISGRLGAAPASETVRDIFERANFTDYDIRPIGSVVDAVLARGLTSPRAMLDGLSAVHCMQAIESGDVVRVEPQLGAPSRATVLIDDLVNDGDNEPFQRTRAQETDLPAVINISYGEPAADDKPGAVRAIRQNTTSIKTLQVSLPCVMPDGKAQATADIMLRDAWRGRETLECGLPPSRTELEPGDVFALAEETETYRLLEISDDAYRRCRAVRCDTDQVIPGHRKRRRASSPTYSVGPAEFVFMDGPLLRDQDDPNAAYIAAYAAPWRSGVAFWRSPDTAGFELDSTMTSPCQIGELAFAFYPGPLWRWDNLSELWVDLRSGQLSSVSDLAVLNGANAIAVENADGEWEVVQYVNAELIAERRYKLTRLLRGQRGSEHAMRNPVAAKARVLVLNEELQQTGLRPEDRGLPINWRVGPAELEVTNSFFQQRTVTIEAKALRPYSPVHLSAVFQADADIKLQWTRRTRIGGDSWAQSKVPLGEESEEYEVEILNAAGTTVKRTISGLITPSYLYPSATQVTDFGAAQTSIRYRVYQISTVFGRGIAGEASLSSSP